MKYYGALVNQVVEISSTFSVTNCSGRSIHTIVVVTKQPGPFPLPLIGNLHLMDPKNPHLTLAAWGKEFGGVYTAWIADPAVIITDYELIKEALITKGEVFAGRPRLFILDMHSQGNYGIILSEGQKWREQKRLCLHILRDFGFGRPLMEDKINAEIENLIFKIDQQISELEVVSLTPFLGYAIGNILNSLVFSHNFDDNPTKYERFKQLYDENFRLMRSPQALLLNDHPWLRYVPILGNFSHKIIRRNLDEIFEYYKEEVESHQRKLDIHEDAHDFLTAYLQAKAVGQLESFSFWQTVVIVGDFWMAGMETTVTTLLWGFLYLILHPGVQDSVYTEIKQIINGRIPQMADRIKMPYTVATIAEIQRKSNITSINVAHKTTQDTILDGHKIPAGTTVIPQIHAVHVDDRLYPEPGEFKPERFLEEDGITLKSFDTLVPFSLGKRVCLGERLARMELFLLFVGLIQKFKFSVDNLNQIPSEEPVFGATLTPQPFSCKIEKREWFLDEKL